jgi:hypothetical protein
MHPFSKWYSHFNLGPLADRAAPGIYSFTSTPAMRSLLNELIKLGAKPGSVRFPWVSIQLVTEVLQRLPGSVWEHQRLDPRVLKAMEFMNQHLGLKLTAEPESPFSAGTSAAAHACAARLPSRRGMSAASPHG